ncbi:hypothetical protein HDU76_010720, partial [Blyttiomyces sp. JEL0837]
MFDLSKEFNLSFTESTKDPSSTASPLGIYNGKEFVYKASQSSWRSVVDAIWRWGYSSPSKSRTLSMEAGNKFGHSYELAENGNFGFASVEELLQALDLFEATEVRADEYFKSQGLTEKYIKEFIEPASRVNYGQDLDLNALSALVCLVAAFVPSESIDGGNSILFEEMLKRSGAHVRLNSKVTELVKTKTDDHRRAATSIRYINLKPPSPINFVHLHVTLVTGVLNPLYFHLSPGAEVPRTILTMQVHPKIPFNSIGVRHVFLDGKTTITKIFSPNRLDDSLLSKIYTTIHTVHRFEWDSYPILKPFDHDDALPKIEVDVGGGILQSQEGDSEEWGGVYHINSFETVLSTMESETVAARNVVELMIRR